MNSAQCKLEIVKWCKANMVALNKDFDSPFTTQEINQILIPNRWKRMVKQTLHNPFGLPPGKYVERIFDHQDFDGDLRGCVVEDAQGNVIEVSAGGE